MTGHPPIPHYGTRENPVTQGLTGPVERGSDLRMWAWSCSRKEVVKWVCFHREARQV